MVSRDRNPANFFALQKVRETIINKMTKKKIFDELLKPNQSYLVQDVGIPDLTHFLYFWYYIFDNTKYNSILVMGISK